MASAGIGTRGGWADALGGALGVPVASVREARLGSLWAGYGHVTELSVTLGPRSGSSSSSTPPGSSSVQERKLPCGVAGLLSRAYQTDVGGGEPCVPLICKQVAPPVDGTGVDHARKLRSYEAEAAFYSTCAQQCLEPVDGSPAVPVPVPVHIASQPPHGFSFVLSDLRQDYPRAEPMLDAQQMAAALTWLARFHSAFWEAPEALSAGLWTPQGSYWHLATRQGELDGIGPEWEQLRRAAERIDAALQGVLPDGGTSTAHMTLCHGDFKAPNLLFTDDSTQCAAYDFQYVGRSYGARDVAYLLARSAREGVLDAPGAEEALLRRYHDELQACLARSTPTRGGAYTYDVLLLHYKLALLDFVRFRVGWGKRTVPAWCSQRAREILAEDLV